MNKTDRDAARDIMRRTPVAVAVEAGIELWSRGLPPAPTSNIGPGDLVMCLRASGEGHFPDNVTCACHECGDMIQHRPYLAGLGATLCCPTCAQKMIVKREG